MKGYRVLSDCTDKNETNCERCEDGTYMDHPNSDHKCQPCKICDSTNMEIRSRCSLYSNSVCRCKENHYCNKGEDCKACFPCDTKLEQTDLDRLSLGETLKLSSHLNLNPHLSADVLG
ncbi:Tumor necrosis factor receptor superfamily member 14 [Labeo rohita]|uniref:Tumor necrosis factor receptor superfamily member 14 n=1 Tax=Labeo rohita TaxID=84645 RepID=A0ABQ8LV93_LABRO|nr:Tumor necrosis factor receptor superfamily member 14 [Labeo rohita]